MMRHHWMTAAAVFAYALLLPMPAVPADLQVTGPDGRRILLKDDGTWRYLDSSPREPAADKPTVSGEGVLTLERLMEAGPNCRVGLRLTNKTDYEIRSIVPSFSVFRASGVLYESRGIGFFSINPGNSLYREILFQGITCKDIARIQVSGGDRCVMGDLDRFSHAGGACLERVRVVQSDLVRFDK